MRFTSRTTRPAVTTLAVAGLIGLSAATSFAGPLKPYVVPPDAHWVVHVDLEALAKSKALKESMFHNHAGVLHEKHGNGKADDIWRQIQERTDFREHRDVLGLTMFNAGEVDDDTVLVVETTERIDEIVDLLPELLPSHRVTTLDGYRVHTWTEAVDDARTTWYGHLLKDGQTTPRVCILSENWRAMVDAIERLSTPPADQPTPELLQLPPGEGSILYVSMDRGLDDVIGDSFDEGPFAALASMKGVVVDLREDAEKVRLDAIIRTDTNEDLQNLVQVGQGLLAFGRMTTAKEEDLRDLHELLKSIDLSVTTRGLRIRLECPVETASRGIEQSGVLVDAGINGREFRVGVGRKGDAAAPEKKEANDANSEETGEKDDGSAQDGS